MNLASLGALNQTGRVWRPIETLGDRRETVRTYEVRTQESAPEDDGIIPMGSTRRLAATSPAFPSGGTVLVGSRKVFADLPCDMEERDVVELVSGPMSPAKLLVEAVSRPQSHHLQALCTEWEGTLPDPDAEES